jgi:hypothetical protein
MRFEALKKGWSAFRHRPLVWLAVSLATLPYAFSLAMGAYQSLLFLLGFLVTFILHFLSWCMAAYAYAAGPEANSAEMLAEARLHLAYRRTGFLYLAAVFGVGVFAVTNFLVPMALTLVLTALQPQGSLALGIILEYLRYLLVALLVAPFALAPQLSILRHDFEEEMQSPTDALRKSYLLVKDRYLRALPLYLVPELVTLTFLLAFSQLAYFGRDFLAVRPYLLVLLVAVLALVEGARTCVIAASFDFFLDEVEVEEREASKKKKKASGQAAGGAKKGSGAGGAKQGGAAGRKGKG